MRQLSFLIFSGCFLFRSLGADLETVFRNPPPAAHPWTYWFWMNGNITREAITSDLEALARAGIKGVLIMEVGRPGNMAPAGPVAFASPEWRQLFKHVIAEGKRLGIEVNMNNDAGWTGSGGPWVTPELSMQKLVSTSVSAKGPLLFRNSLPTPKTKHPYYKDLAVLAYPATAQNSSNAVVRAEQVRVLTEKLDKDGTLTWEVPKGDWAIMRIGHTSTWVTNKPAPQAGLGLECDKLNPDAIQRHLDAFIGRLVHENASETGKVLTMSHIDSWEVGGQDWTPGLSEEFRKRYGYDLVPWLITLTGGPLLNDAEQARRFSWDFNRLKATLMADNYARAAREALHRYGLKLSIENYGPDQTLIDPLVYGAEADLPMGEFWVERWDAWHLLSCRTAASVAHVFGKPIVGAESFTAMPNNDPWTQYPYSLKALADWALCEGINRNVFHRTVLNPFIGTNTPGMSFAGFGTHFDRAQTWWPLARPFMDYLSRCQALLQEGHFVADVCRLAPDSRNFGRNWNLLPSSYAPLPVGFNYDFVSERALLKQISVKNGRLITPTGMSYALLQLPESQEMTPELLGRLTELVRAGAVIAGPRPDRSPSLQNYPHCDVEVRKLANEIWGNCDGQRVLQHPYGKGRVFWGEPMETVLRRICGAPDFFFALNPPIEIEALRSPARIQPPARGATPTAHMLTSGLNWIHRRTPSADLYFIANPQHRAVDTVCKFRIQGKRPEFWNPENGVLAKADIFLAGKASMSVPIHLGPAGSAFIVFRERASGADPVVTVKRDGQKIFGRDSEAPVPLPNSASLEASLAAAAPPGVYEFVTASGHARKLEVRKLEPQVLAGPWDIHFYGPGAPSALRLPSLVDWSKHSDAAIRYFSGVGSYSTSFTLSPEKGLSYLLELGDVQVVAEVMLNGNSLGVLWKPPFTIDVTRALKTGANELTVRVANLWPNRLIGDEQFPDDCTTDGSWLRGPIPAWPEWLVKKQPRPETRRVTFTTWKYYGSDDPLLPSGLLGPVCIQPVSTIVSRR